MKKLTLSLILLTSLLSSNDLVWIDEQIDAIKPPRSGEHNSKISRISDPFIFLEKNGYKPIKKISKKTDLKKNDSNIKSVFSSSLLRLSMIMNGSALINNKWYKVDDWVKKYKIIEISNSSVTLRRNSKTKVISTASKNDNLKFKRQ
ncbi:MAG: hypothetical protein L3I99_01475 [Sulfurimonas sp.]|nr:hypothetical protein [Sulfurimonas sp.]